ncbi:Subversion of eukaryotic vesicle trafficking A [Legionella massiliensis]|uniref:Subversion of eukaryotic vesicle trafficking A n=1 Tax=Legionella massiliensis TaxID=1034943 RepID=A0A078KRT4_9GAMM|nr:hypothetical protein [Legionella massiliensis]CDZ77150.1 Subversion of eukaryotic vesicle trafficking A [Legionella massiliensis]CEE12888.1 Subversion of eukaryotic traffic protein A [Legionella massiliensis]
MKIRSKRSVGFQNVYTHEEALPKSIAQPEKKPFIILTLPADSSHINYLARNFPLFKQLGYSEIQGATQILTITSNRKVSLVINAILASPDYNHDENTELLSSLRSIEQRLAKPKNSKALPPKSKAQENYKPVNAPIVRESGAPEPSHSASKVTKGDGSPIEILKTEKSGRRITEIEAFNGMLFRLVLNDRTPKVRSVHDADGNRVGVLSRAIDNFQSLHDYYLKQQQLTGAMRSPPQADLVKAGIGRILAAAYFGEERDMHGGNVGYDPVAKIASKIDHDQASWPITSKYQNRNPNKVSTDLGEREYGVKPKDTFPITQRDISNFPHLVDAKPRNFPEWTDSRLLDLSGIENHPEFVKDVFSVFIKGALFDAKIYRAIAKETLQNPKFQERMVAHKTRRSEILKEELTKNEKFLDFLLDNPNIKDQIIAELGEYNNDYKEGSPLRLDLVDLANKFDELVQQTMDRVRVPLIAKTLFMTNYQPDQDINLYQYKATAIASDRKQTTIDNIRTTCNISENKAELIFNKIKKEWDTEPQNSKELVIERNAANALKEILNDIINLDGKLGVFGGKKRTLDDGREIKIPNGAAAIFDLYQQYQNNDNVSAVTTLNTIIAQASLSTAYQGHGWFNQRQTQTTDFYHNIIAIPQAAVENQIDNTLMI